MTSQEPRECFLNVPYEERWELFKPVLDRLYNQENLKLSEIESTMKSDYRFNAVESQYKYRFNKKWNWKRSISASKKKAVLEKVQSRARLGKSTATPTYKGRPIEHKLRRHAKEITRKQQSMIGLSRQAEGLASLRSRFGSPFGDRIFMNWNLPYAALNMSMLEATDHASPFSPTAATPSDVVMHTPPADGLSPRVESSLSTVLIKKTLVDRAQLLIRGDHAKLLRSLDKTEAKILSTWLYQFWLFAFKSAKHWGPKHQTWTAKDLGFDRQRSQSSVSHPGTPRGIEQSWVHAGNDRETHVNHIGNDHEAHTRYTGKRIEAHVDCKPSSLCNWSIHIELNDENIVPHSDLDIDEDQDELSRNPTIQETLVQGLQSNSFSNINADHMPLAIQSVARAASKSSVELFEESLGFAIMGRNYYLVETLLYQAANSQTDISKLYPYHLAATYLDGSNSCCTILDLLVASELPLESMIWKNYVNPVGHTVLDNLMITILKSHISCVPGMVDSSWKHLPTFPGEEVDICGRWDADSACYRYLLETEGPSIPVQWKHKFCNTSVQAICHGIFALGRISNVLEIASGLFINYCSHCGQNLVLSPFHALVVVTFLLAQNARPDEDLFGALAILFCFAKLSIDPASEAEISIPLLLEMTVPDFWTGNQVEDDCCSHESLTPLKFATKISEHVMDQWPDAVGTGWKVICFALEQYNAGYDGLQSPNKQDIAAKHLRLGEHPALAIYGQQYKLSY
ncbi:hypothetical protein MMC25_007914 [Agyrium rufum]|nr:hypothetical protein [Agyrium rufum]